MIKKLSIIALCVMSTLFSGTRRQLELMEQAAGIQSDVQVKSSADYETTPIVIISFGPLSPAFSIVMDRVQYDLTFTENFTVRKVVNKQLSSYKDNSTLDKILLDNKASFAVVVMNEKDRVSWYVYQKNQTVKQDPTYITKDSISSQAISSKRLADQIADSVYTSLTSYASPFLSYITYCKQLPNDVKKGRNYLCIARWDGSDEDIILPQLDTQSDKELHLYMSPVWHPDAFIPKLLYSVHTPVNIELRCLKFKDNNQNPLLNDFSVITEDGINMLPTFSKDGSQVLVCMSFAGKTNIYRYISGQKDALSYVPFTANQKVNKGINLSPCLLNPSEDDNSDDGDIVFSSDYLSPNVPKIYRANNDGSDVTLISDANAIATSCAYSYAVDKVVYCQKVSGVFQLMVYNCKTGKIKQITQDRQHKANPVWSPCGNYILCTVIEEGKPSRLAYYKLLVGKKRHYIKGTSDGSLYSDPAWSCNFDITIDLFASEWASGGQKVSVYNNQNFAQMAQDEQVGQSSADND